MTAEAQTPVRIVAPATEPLTVAEVKDHLRVTGSDENTLIGVYLSAAVSWFDGWHGQLSRCMVTQTWRQDWDGFGTCIPLPFPDVQSVSVAYTDTAGDPQTLSASVYHLVHAANVGKLVLADGQSWPSTAVAPDAVRVTVACGFGDADDVPAAIKAAMLLYIGHLFENREASVVGVSVTPLPLAVDALIAPYRRMLA